MRADIVIYNLLKDTSNIFPFVIPQSTAITDGNVYMTYSVVETDSVTTKTSFNDYDRTTVQLSFFSASLDAAMVKADTVRLLIDRYSAILTVATVEYDVDLISFVSQDFVGYDEDNEVYMIAADYQISLAPVYLFQQVVQCGTTSAATLGKTIKVEDFPLLWLQGGSGGYYDAYKADTFLISGSGCIFGGGVSDYGLINQISLIDKSLTTSFTNNFLSKINNLQSLNLNDNLGISIVDLSSLSTLSDISLRSLSISVLNVTSLVVVILNAQNNQINSLTFSSLSLCEQVRLDRNLLTSFDATSLIVCTLLEIYANSLTDLDLSAAVNLVYCRCQNNSLNNLVNSQLLIDLDTHGLSNGLFQGNIDGGGELTAAGASAKSNLQGKNWTITGL